jgi:hypothetical protein
MHIDRQDLERLVVDQLPNAGLSAIQFHLQECGECQAEFAAQLDAGNSETSPARIKVLDPITSNGPSGEATVLNSSSRGLHARVPRSIFVGSLVHVRSSLGNAFGKVRYCIPSGEEFQIGVKLETAA